MDLNIKDEQLQLFVSKAILDTLTEENKNILIQNAIQQFISVPEKKFTGDKTKSPLQYAFENAIENIARQKVHEYIKEDETFMVEIKKIYAASMQQVLSEETRDQLIKDIAKSITQAFSDFKYKNY